MPDTQPVETAAPQFERETALEQQARLKQETAMIAEAESEIAAGYWLDEAELDAWLEAVAVNPHATLPGRKNHLP